MAKRSHKRPARHEKAVKEGGGLHQHGCMWGLINMFDFRHGRTTQRLLSDRRRSNKHSASSGSPRKKPDTPTSGENGQGTQDEGKTTGADTFKLSVKKLIEEEMSAEKMRKNEKINAEEESRQPESGQLDRKQKNRGSKNKNHSKSFDNVHDLETAEALGSGGPCHHQSEQPTSNNLDMDNLMEEFCHQIYQKTVDCSKLDHPGEIGVQANHNIADFREKLTEVVKLLVSQKLINGDYFTQNGELQTSKELVEALRILSSDEELILKLLRDPNSLAVRYIPDLPDSLLKKDEESEPLLGSNLSEQKLHSSTKPDELVCRKQRNFFRRKAKSNENNDFQASNKIVILKPTETGSSLGLSLKHHNISKSGEANEKAGSQFSLAEIKRKFKHAMGKEQHRTSSGGISKISFDRQNVGDGGMVKEYVGMNSPTKDHFFIEKIARPSASARKWEKMGRMKYRGETADLSTQKVTNIYVEAKKHLSDILSNGHENVDFTSKQVPKTLGKILSLPEFSSSPVGSPGGKKDATALMKLTGSDEVQKINDNNKSEHDTHRSQTAENLENEPCSSDDKTAVEVQDNNLSLRTSVEGVNDNHENGTSCPIRNDTTPEGTGWISETTEIAVRDESTSSIPGDGKDVNIAEIANEKPHHESSKQYSCEEDQHPVSPLASPPNSLVTKKVEFPETYTDTQERPSPVSALEPPFTDDVISPSSGIFQTSQTSTQPRKIGFEESDSEEAKEGIHKKNFVDDKEIIFEYVKSMLKASSLSWEELLVKSLSSERFLDPSLLDEVQLPSNQLCLDQKLLFDCINEVLIEIQEHYFGSYPWVSFIKPDIRPIPNMKCFRQEVWQGVYWHLLPVSLPCTLDQIVRKDMSKSETWLDLRLDTDCIGTEMGEAILEDMMEDTLLSYVDANQEDVSCILDELKKNGSGIHIDDHLKIDHSILSSRQLR